MGCQESRTLVFTEGRFRWAGKWRQALQTESFCEATRCWVMEQTPALWVDLLLFLEQEGRTGGRMWGDTEVGH